MKVKNEKNSKYKNLVFLCGARDFHAMDWYRRALEELPNINIYILTDLIKGENFKKLITSKDIVFKLIIIDNLLLRDQSSLGNYWRHFIKIIVFPLQVYLIRKFSKSFPDSIFYAHAMYYIWLAKFAGVEYVGRPQGNDIFTKPFKSRIFKFLSIKGINNAKAIIVDSFLMYESIQKFTQINNVFVIPNGIDLGLIKKLKQNSKEFKRKYIVSIRALYENYRIKDILISRSLSKESKSMPIQFIYPFYDKIYKNDLKNLFIKEDKDISRLDKSSLYSILYNTKLVISIPTKDSFPRSVFESIFCGCIVAISYNSYYDHLPTSIKSRIILVNPNDENWFINAVNETETLLETPFKPCEKALKLFDQKNTFKEMAKIIFN
tara:strand:- start:921 stop:2054 length:1134 start_codon:yes stop_codon:yes gene_type:complete